MEAARDINQSLEAENIDPSSDIWRRIYISLDGLDISDTTTATYAEAYNDFQSLQALDTLNIARVVFLAKSKKAVLIPISGCTESSFPDEIKGIMRAHNSAVILKSPNYEPSKTGPQVKPPFIHDLRKTGKAPDLERAQQIATDALKQVLIIPPQP